MEYGQVGASGLRVSRFGLGMMSFGDRSRRSWHLDFDAGRPIIEAAAAGGVTFFDTADMYDQGASEELTGRLLRSVFPDREDYVLATKVFYPMGASPNGRGLSRAHIMAGIDASLRRLGVDHVDIYQVHRWDSATPIEETMTALHDVVRAGKARYLGASTMRAWQFSKAQHVASSAGLTPFVSMQNHYNLLSREDEREMIPLCDDLGVGLMPYSPLARGRLARDPRASTSTRGREGADPVADALYGESAAAVVDDLRAVSHDLGRLPAQVALAWLFGHPLVAAPIIGATSVAHVQDALAATDLVLDPEDRIRLERGYRPQWPDTD